jgi:hypothetical protein
VVGLFVFTGYSFMLMYGCNKRDYMRGHHEKKRKRIISYHERASIDQNTDRDKLRNSSKNIVNKRTVLCVLKRIDIYSVD